MIKVYQTIECKNNVITTIAFKGVKVKVEFTGGNVMKNIPARLYTKDPFVQKALDESDQKGRMYRLVQEVAGEGDEMAVLAGKAAGTAAHGLSRQDGQSGRDGVDGAPEPGFPEPAGEGGEEDAGEGGTEKLEFENLAEAITYIAATWGEQVESESQARKLIEEKTGVKPVIHKG